MMNRFYFEDQAEAFQRHMNQFSRFVLLVDARTNGYCTPLLYSQFPKLREARLITIPQGEAYKTLDTCSYIWSMLMQLETDTSTLVLILGGGVLCDLGAFACSVFKRGLDVMLIPTTLLAMTDACYGGKNGFDFMGVKNMIGLIRQPEGIYIQPAFLRSLPERVIRCGYAEMIKHALLSDQQSWQQICNASPSALCSTSYIRHSLEIKARLIGDDLYDQHDRQRLNFGHSIGHAIESYLLQGDNPLMHGEAIMLGMAYELRLSQWRYNCPSQLYVELIELLQKLFPGWILPMLEAKMLLPFLRQDKKNKNGIRMSLLQDIGHCVIQAEVDEALLYQCLATPLLS